MNGLPPIEEGYVSHLIEGMSNDPLQYAFPRTGNFIIERDTDTKELKPETLKLYDDFARVLIQPSQVAFRWDVSSPREGRKKFPKPFVYERTPDQNNPANPSSLSLKVIGEKLLIEYINGNIKQPIIVGAVESLAVIAQENFLRIDQSNLDRQVEKYETDNYIYAYENDGNGEFRLVIQGLIEDSEKKNTGGTGNITVDLLGTEGNGNFTFGVNGNIILNQKDASGKIIQQLSIDLATKKLSFNQLENETIVQSFEMDLTNGGIKAQGKTEKSKKEYIVYGETLKDDILKALLDAISNMTFSNGGGLTGIPNNVASFTAITQKLETILVK